ncbi:hypothetical protein B0J12DRAFT_697389 [Macrophomina phaseolina]|uniref:DUF6594 domain-containing protein n=1 Tax=Macrophomina phaseolina TaxID=35725 RepID=A0ABQ8GGJ2_9PEZI|nr:hypothetical protein B0J12DRAFT_697389 [Macrophomina phaseolina]
MAKKGYAKIAALMAWNPEAAMVRQLSELTLQKILYLQAEIVGLEQDFWKLEAQNDASDDEDRAAFSLDWYALGNTEEGDERYTGCEDLGKLNKQWRLALRIREGLKGYRKHLPV